MNFGDLKKQLGGVQSVSLSRRGFMLTGAAGTAAVMVPQTALAADRVKTSARIVIAGAGAAGLAAASHLATQLDGAKIILVDARKAHYYQPGFTLVAAGLKKADYTVSATRDYVPAGVELIEEGVAEFDPVGNKVVTTSGTAVPYDYLIVATGLKLDYASIPGMDLAQIGKNGLGSLYYGPEAATATWQAMSTFADQGGVGVFQRPGTEMKCAGAPLKYAFITDDYLRRRGKRDKSELVYHANNKVLFSVPIVSERVRMLFEQRGFKVNYERTLDSLDLGKKVATFKTLDGLQEQPYDFINVIPPMRAPDAVRNSPLPWQDGGWAKDGWIEVDKFKLQHKRFANIWAIGDVAGVPKGKTAASVKWQAPVAVDHVVAAISGKESSSVYNGYTSCPLITRLGQAMLVEFDYKDNLTPSFPGIIAPLEELWITWVMKTMALKPTYISMLRGQA